MQTPQNLRPEQQEVADRLARAERLAQEILGLARSTLLVHLRFLDQALHALTLVSLPDIFATDGSSFFYDARYVLRRFREERESVVRDYLHITLHCVFRHMFVGPEIDREVWDLACDVAVEGIICDLGLTATRSAREAKQKPYLEQLKGEIKVLTAERIYRYYQEHPLFPGQMDVLKDRFRADMHAFWYLPPPAGQQKFGGGGDEKQGEPKASAVGIEDKRDKKGDAPQSHEQEEKGDKEAPNREKLEEQWKDISERMQTELETAQRQMSGNRGNLLQTLKALNRETYDYGEFLRRFAVSGEAIQVDPDSFDYIFYTYGLKLYGNLPLIEPLEYQEVKRIRSFVIAIDTSGSVSGPLVQSFVQKTFNILKSQESFFSRIDLHIIQCDAEVQEDIAINTREDFEHYIKSMELHGGGGTDFRPVFRRVEELRRNHELPELKGLIYFTDGLGVFPERPPDYDAAFVFLEGDEEPPETPPWAIRIVLKPEQLSEP